MANRKDSINAFGKSWSIIDLPNIKEAIKLVERLNQLTNNFASSMSSSHKIMSQLNEQERIKQKLQEKGIKYSEDQLKYLVRELETRRSINSTTYGPEGVLRDAASRSNNNGQFNQRFSLNNAGTFFTNAAKEKFATNEFERQLDKQSRLWKMNRDSDVVRRQAERAAATNLIYASKKFETAGSIIQVAADTFSKAISVFTRLFTQGISNQTNAYENSFTNISVRNAITRGDYFSSMLSTRGYLERNALLQNIKVSDIQNTWNTMASKGLNIDLSSARRDVIITRSIESAITNTIIPYLDTNSTYFQQLVDQQPILLKQIRGIGLATQEVSGSSVFVNKYLQEMVDNLSPMASLAKNQLGVQFAQMSGMYENLRSQGLSEASIGELYRNAASIYNNPLAALRSGNLNQQWAVAYGISQGIDWRDVSQVSQAALRGDMFSSSLLPNGRMSPIYQGMLNSSLSVPARVELNGKNVNIYQALASGIETSNKLDAAANKATTNFQNNMNQTVKDLQETSIENITTWLATISAQIGVFSDVVSTLFSGLFGVLTGVVGTKITGNIGSSLLSGLGAGAGGKAVATKIGGNAVARRAVTGASGKGLGTKATTLLGSNAGMIAGAIGSGALGIYNGVQAYNDFQNGKIGYAAVETGAAATGVTGGILLGLGTLAGAESTIPVAGWILAAITLALTGVVAAAKAIEETGKKDFYLSQFYEAEKKQSLVNLSEEYDTTELYLKDARSAIQHAIDDEEARSIALQAGIISQEELSEAANITKASLLEMADATIQETKEREKIEQQLIDKYYNIKQTQKDKGANPILQLMGEAQWTGKGYGKLTDEEKVQMNDFMKTIIQYAEQTGWAESDNDIKYRLGQWKGYFKGETLSEEGFHRIFDGDNATTRKLFGAFASSDLGSKMLSAKDSLSGYYGGFYSALDDSTLTSYMNSALKADDIDSSKKYLRALKGYGLNWSDLPLAARTSLLDKYGDDIKSYRSGLSYVPYDNYLANLHEGEAVITASTASELRNLIAEYRDQKQTSINLDTAINNQTVILSNKLDEVIQAVNGSSSSNSINTYRSNLQDAMKHMRSSKSFIN